MRQQRLTRAKEGKRDRRGAQGPGRYLPQSFHVSPAFYVRGPGAGPRTTDISNFRSDLH